jgi:UDP-N-acetylmuramate dehydrogenase
MSPTITPPTDPSSASSSSALSSAVPSASTGRSSGVWSDPAAVALALELLGDLAVADGPLGARTTYRVGGPGAVVATVHGVEHVLRVIDAARRSGLPILPVGRGSNLLVADRGFDGIAVVLGKGMSEVVFADTSSAASTSAGPTVTAGGATSLPVLARKTVAAGYSGLEWAVGVPGTVGGAVRMNAGGHGSDTSLLVRSARIVSVDSDLAIPEVVTLTNQDLQFGYRHSTLTDRDIVIDATFELSAGDPAAGSLELNEIVRWRREHQPGGQNAGSVFVNPGGASAGAIIEELGLKGHRVGTAEVSNKHANFIQADVGGSADDVLALMRDVADRVRIATGHELRTEIRTVGFSHATGLES